MTELREKVCVHVDLSLKNTQYNEELCFAVPPKTVKRLFQILHLNIEDYTCVIKKTNQNTRNEKNDTLQSRFSR